MRTQLGIFRTDDLANEKLDGYGAARMGATCKHCGAWCSGRFSADADVVCEKCFDDRLARSLGLTPPPRIFTLEEFQKAFSRRSA